MFAREKCDHQKYVMYVTLFLGGVESNDGCLVYLVCLAFNSVVL